MSDERALRAAFKAGEEWGVTYATWFSPTEEQTEAKIQDALRQAALAPSNAADTDQEHEAKASGSTAACLRLVLDVAREAHLAVDDGEELSEGRMVIDVRHLVPLLDALDELPDDKPGYAMSGPARAEWALRPLWPNGEKRSGIAEAEKQDVPKESRAPSGDAPAPMEEMQSKLAYASGVINTSRAYIRDSINRKLLDEAERAIDEVREALAALQPAVQGEPVAYVDGRPFDLGMYCTNDPLLSLVRWTQNRMLFPGTPLFTHPAPAQPVVPLDAPYHLSQDEQAAMARALKRSTRVLEDEDHADLTAAYMAGVERGKDIQRDLAASSLRETAAGLADAVMVLNAGWNAKEPEHLIAERIDYARRLARQVREQARSGAAKTQGPDDPESSTQGEPKP